jgi:hypothetical protein
MKISFIKMFIVLSCIFSSCNRIQNCIAIDETADVFPDYSGGLIPPNIAPLNFQIRENNKFHIVRFIAGSDSMDVNGRHFVKIPAKKWKRLIGKNAGKELSIQIFAKKEGVWVKYRTMRLDIAKETIDPYIAYRLIEPGYEYWEKTGIYRRHIESFDEKPVLMNSLTGEGCMNCHSFCKNDPGTMLFHVRAEYPGTIIKRKGKISKIDTKTPDNISAAVYPRWHPDGRYIAFSTNKTLLTPHSIHDNLAEVYDTESDLVIYDTETNVLFTHPLIHSPKRFETYPEWSPDGTMLYFCSAPALKMPEKYDSLRYDLFRIAFDAKTGIVGNRIDTVWKASEIGKSVAFPRFSPDGRYLLVCLSDYGTFPIWHRENDLYLFDMQTGETRTMPEVNSDESDSYHSWSSNGRWLIFSSRRIDGLYTRLYISYFDRDGNFHKPFLLPQKDPSFYDYFLKSYNVPEFVSGKITTSIRAFERIVKGEATKVSTK